MGIVNENLSSIVNRRVYVFATAYEQGQRVSIFFSEVFTSDGRVYVCAIIILAYFKSMYFLFLSSPWRNDQQS